MPDEPELTVPQRQHAPKGRIKVHHPDLTATLNPTGTKWKTRCVAKAKSTGQRCTLPPIAGSTVCRAHGGAAPQVKEAARERLRALVYPALAAYDELLQQTEFPTVRFATAKDVLHQEFGSPTQTVAQVTKIVEEMPDDELMAHLRTLMAQIE